MKLPWVIVIVIVVFLLWSWFMLANPPKMVNKPFNQLQFKTGDIILFHAYNNINPVFIGSYWGHIGIVYNTPDNNSKPLLFEAAKTSAMKNCPEYNKHGIMITDLKTRLEKYPGLVACKFLNKHVDSCISAGLEDFMKYAKNHMYYNEDVFHNGVQKKAGQDFNESTNCGEIVLLSLVKLGLLPQKTLKANIAHHLLHTAHLTKLENDYYYLPPLELTFNPF
jgi:hypothetical protein